MILSFGGLKADKWLFHARLATRPPLPSCCPHARSKVFLLLAQPITRYPHDRMPNYIAYSNSAKSSRIQPRVLGQVFSYSANCTRPKYSRSRPKLTRPKFTRPKHSRNRPKVTRPSQSDSAKVIQGKLIRIRPDHSESAKGHSAISVGLGQSDPGRAHSDSANFTGEKGDRGTESNVGWWYTADILGESQSSDEDS